MIGGDPHSAIVVRGPRREITETLEWDLALELNGHKPVRRRLVLPSGQLNAEFEIAVEKLAAADTGRAVIESPFQTADGRPAMPDVGVFHKLPSAGTALEYLTPRPRPDGAWEVTLPVGPATLRVAAEVTLGGEFAATTDLVIVSGGEARVAPKFPPHGTARFHVSRLSATEGRTSIRLKRTNDKSDQPGGLVFTDGEAFVSAMPEGEWYVTCEIDGQPRHARFTVTAEAETLVELLPGK